VREDPGISTVGRADRNQFASRLLRWFGTNKRAYPWRETSSPYRVLMAEFMLQRTGAAQTVPVYREFTKRYPSLSRAALVPERRLASVLTPLGRTGRARHLRRALAILRSRFRLRVPDREELLLEIPSVGRYTARAVLVFAFERRLGLFDPNIARLLSRVFGIVSSRSRAHTDPAMWAAVDLLVPKRRAKEFNWALLDLGATVCLSRRPRCTECPMTSLCRYYHEITRAA